MVEKDRIKWNKRYNDSSYNELPSEIVRKYSSLAPNKKALDIASGTGRNALFLAESGFDVDAVDISDVALQKINKAFHPKINCIAADLDTYEIPENNYDLIININYLNRRLFPYIRQALTPGGVLIFETYVEGEVKDELQVSCKDYLLKSNELLYSFLWLKIIYYKEETGISRHGPACTASLAGIQNRMK
ncbi:SAM-dependent methyltransferase [Desulfonema limicola]|uniref:SAM-dependent methyltransferase n=1 Tax=Desulfonema limicola TaxID=45656 RepID=A0A975GGL4_9BACT|nr:class I SAM-dependent methyltransferase [Desulfonema limicola]QTA80441.1 SAM-dependent methyltransferase [Desulfonema limicola]